MEAQGQAPAVPSQQPAQDEAQTVAQQSIPETNMSSRAPQSTEAHNVIPPTTEQPMQGNGPMFPTQDGNFAGLQHPVNSNNVDGTFPNAGLMMTTDQPMMGLNGSSAGHSSNGNNMTADEIALYDRQIRLWGMQAQQKIQSANVLLITMKGLGNEIAKALVLAGIGSLTLIDDQIVSDADLGTQFLVSEENIGQNRAGAAAAAVQKMNPRVKVYPDSGSIMTKGASYFSAFDIVIATDLNPTLLAFINTATRLHDRQFYAAGTHGFFGYVFCDLIEHDFVVRRDKTNVTTAVGPETRTRSIAEVKTQEEGGKKVELVSKRELYSTWDLASETSLLPAEYLKSKRRLKAVTPALSCLRALWAFQQTHNRNPGHNKQDLEFFTRSATHNHQLLSLPAETLNSEFLRRFLQNIGSEIAPVTAIVGAGLAQDVINVLGQNQAPIQNMVIYDSHKMTADKYPLHPEGNLGRAQLELTTPMVPMGQVDTSQMLPIDQANNMMPGSSM